jgi:hypothetical protein
MKPEEDRLDLGETQESGEVGEVGFPGDREN